MGARSGGSSSGGGGGLRGDSTYRGSIKNVESLVHMKDPAMYKATKEAISRYYAALGIEQRNIKLADLGKGVYGVHVTSEGKSEGIYLNKRYFNKSLKEFVNQEVSDYKAGWSTKTNKPSAHTVTHELAHATWNNHMTGTKQVTAGKDIKQLYKKWSADSKKTGYGKYSKTNINEFWAETITKGIHGKADKYTRKAMGIARKYNL